MPYNCLFDGTPRPKWADDVRVKSANVPAAKCRSDRRNNPRLLGGFGEIAVPVSISATVLPVTTKKDQQRNLPGRGATPNAPGSDLARTQYDRGHLMAFSLGSPRTEDIMFPQARSMNQDLDNKKYEIGLPNDLSWRAMEIYCKFVATYGLEGKMLMPDPKIHVQIWTPEKVAYGEATAEYLPTIVPTFYADPNCYPNRTFLVHYSATCRYKGRHADDVTSIKVKVEARSINRKVAPVTLINKEYDNVSRLGIDDKILDAFEEKLDQKVRAAFKNSRHPKPLRLLFERWGYTSGMLDDDAMDVEALRDDTSAIDTLLDDPMDY